MCSAPDTYLFPSSSSSFLSPLPPSAFSALVQAGSVELVIIWREYAGEGEKKGGDAEERRSDPSLIFLDPS